MIKIHQIVDFLKVRNFSKNLRPPKKRPNKTIIIKLYIYCKKQLVYVWLDILVPQIDDLL